MCLGNTETQSGEERNAVYANSSRGPTFGGGHDICIFDEGNNNMKKGWTNLKNIYYEIPSGASSTFLTGKTGCNQYFNIAEVEVFKV